MRRAVSSEPTRTRGQIGLDAGLRVQLLHGAVITPTQCEQLMSAR